MAVVSGGTTLIDNGALDAGVPTGSLILLSTQTASASTTIDFTSGIDSTYDSYVFKFINCHPSNNTVGLYFNGSTDGGSNYNVTKTTTYFLVRHQEDDSSSELSYKTDLDLAQSTAFQPLSIDQVNDNDASVCGFLHLYNPSNTTFVKHFISRTQESRNVSSMENYVGGYFNTTSAINAVQFQFNSGNIDDGIIKMYGVK